MSNSLNFHQLRVHYIDGTNYCKICDIKFDKLASILTHMKRHARELFSREEDYGLKKNINMRENIKNKIRKI